MKNVLWADDLERVEAEEQAAKKKAAEQRAERKRKAKEKALEEEAEAERKRLEAKNKKWEPPPELPGNPKKINLTFK
jgi:hypothetical protein